MVPVRRHPTYYVRMYAHDNLAREEASTVPLPDDAHVDTATRMLRLLADGTRLRLMWLLCHGRHDVTTLTAALGTPRPATSQHLAKLRLAGMVRTHREGRRVYYTARHGHVRRLVAEVVQAADHQLTDAPDHP